MKHFGLGFVAGMAFLIALALVLAWLFAKDADEADDW